MDGNEALSVLAIGILLGIGAREIVAYWAEVLRALVADVRRLFAPKPAPVAQEAKPVVPITDDEFNTIHGWARLNPWYVEDGQLNLEAQVIHMGLKHREPHLSLQANLAEVTAEMHRRHPEIVPTRQ